MSTVPQTAKRHYRRWTAAEREYIRHHRSLVPPTSYTILAKRLGTTAWNLKNLTYRWGFLRKKRIPVPEGPLRALHAEGHSCREISRRLKRSHTSVLSKHHALGLVPNGLCASGRKRLANAAIRNCAYEYPIEYKARKAEAMGWSCVWYLIDAHVLQALWDHGPMPTKTIAEKSGHHWEPIRKAVRRLIDGGLIKKCKTKGKRPTYKLLPGVRPTCTPLTPSASSHD